MNYLQQYQQEQGLVADGDIGPKTAEVMMADLGITSKIAFCHFMAQIRHESGNFKAGRENLNYSVSGLRSVFGKYFSPTDAAKYARQPEKIANRVYANRMGNGDEESGDGWKYRGAGSLQLTGKNNIQAFFEYAGLPEDTDPDVLAQPEYYFKTAKYFFDVNDVWQYCQDKTDLSILKTSKKINIGNANSIKKPNGLEERQRYTYELFRTLSV